MARHGTFKYVCDECHQEQWLNKIAFTRAARTRCQYCGSTWLTAVAKEAKEAKAKDRVVDALKEIIALRQQSKPHKDDVAEEQNASRSVLDVFAMKENLPKDQ